MCMCFESGVILAAVAIVVLLEFPNFAKFVGLVIGLCVIAYVNHVDIDFSTIVGLVVLGVCSIGLYLAHRNNDESSVVQMGFAVGIVVFYFVYKYQDVANNANLWWIVYAIGAVVMLYGLFGYGKEKE